jgi:membrane-associated phospholipid phosphatase
LEEKVPFSPIWQAYAAIIFIVLMGSFWWQKQAPERELFLAINHWASAWPPGLWVFFTRLGETGILFVLLSPLLLWRPQALFSVLAAVPAGGLMSVSAKFIFDAPRPPTVIDVGQIHVIGPLLNNVSFPSGHSITAFAAAAAMAAVWACQPATRKTAGSVAKPVVLAALMFGAAAMVGLSRIAVGAHWPVDVLAGACVGALAGLSGAWAMWRFPAVWQSVRNQRVLCAGLAGTAVWLVGQPVEYPWGALPVWLAVISLACTVVGQVLAWRRTLSAQSGD